MNNKLKNSGLILTFFLTIGLFIGVPVISNSEDKVRVVEGLIETVTGNSIEVRDKYYNILGIPLKDASGEDLSKAELKKGRKVELFFHSGSLTTVLIYNKNMVE